HEHRYHTGHNHKGLHVRCSVGRQPLRGGRPQQHCERGAERPDHHQLDLHTLGVEKQKLNQIENEMHGGRILALPTGPAGAGESRTTRNIAITLLVVVPLVAMYLAMWKFWFTSDFLASLAAAAQQSVVSGSGIGLFADVLLADLATPFPLVSVGTKLSAGEKKAWRWVVQGLPAAPPKPSPLTQCP